MSNNREFSQLASFINVDETNNFIGIATGGTQLVGIGTSSITLDGRTGIVSAKELYVDGVNVEDLISSNTFSGITVKEEGSIVGTASSILTLDFIGTRVTATASGSISTITVADYVSYADNAGIATYATNAGIATYATSAGIATYSTNAGIATYASNAGIATNLKGGLAGNIPYQSAIDTTTFLANGASGTILQSNGVGNAPSWVPAAPASAISGLTIRDEGNIVGTANSISQLNFVGDGITATASGNISTITISPSSGIQIRDEGTIVGSAITSINVVGAGISATASGTATTITSLSPTGGGTDGVFYLNDNTVNTSYTIPLNKNALSAGPITIAVGATVTINAGSNWLVVV